MTTSSIVEGALVAIDRGDYELCLSFLEPLSKKYPIGTQEGAKIRMLMITAWMGQGDDEKAITTCKLLTKTPDPQIRQEAKQLISILEAPNLPRPKDWSIQIPNIVLETNSFPNKLKPSKLKTKRDFSPPPPTGPTKAFDIGFSILFIVIIIILTIFLSI